MNSLPRINVTAGILYRSARVLIAQRSEPRYNGLWEFPGGKIEENEDAEECLIRELHEELGIHVKVKKLFCRTEWSRQDKVIILHTFEIESFECEPIPKVHSQLKWVDIKELRKEELLPADRPVVDKLKSSLGSI